MTRDEGAEQKVDEIGTADIANVLREISKAANDVHRDDVTNRQQVRALADRLVQEAARAHIYASSSTFDLVKDSYDEVHGVYGHLAVGPHGFYLATRRAMDDIFGHDRAPDGEALYSTLAVESWPVEWLRLIVAESRMLELAEGLLQAIREHLANPSKNASLPPDMQMPSPDVVQAATQLSFPRVVETWREMQRERLSNPSGALRTACVLLETVCKHVLGESGADVPTNPTLPRVYKAAARELDMNRDERTLATGIRGTIDGIAHGRSRLSNAHGSGREDAAPTAEHVDLAVTASGALAVHLMQLLARRGGKKRPHLS